MSIDRLYDIYTEYDIICTDSRKIVPDSIFFALKGADFDGNSFVKQVLEQGCAYAVSDDLENSNLEGCIIVENVLKTLQDLAAFHRDRLKIPVLAVTGTNGKTTTKELINAVLSKKFKTKATVGNLNNHIGVPLTILSVDRKDEFAIIETGANRTGDIAELCKMAKPDYGLITNIGKAHLEGFIDAEGVKKAKGELYDYINDRRGRVFYNCDDPVLSDMVEEREHLLTSPYGRKIFEAEITTDKFLVSVSLKNPRIKTDTHLVGRRNADNILAAVAVGLYFGVNEEDIAKAVSEYLPLDNRSRLLDTGKNTVIADAYNANPSSMSAAIEDFAETEADNKCLILGDMLELGSESVTEHKRIVESITEKGFRNVILVGNNFSQSCNNPRYKTFADREKAFEYLKNKPLRQSSILMKGSRGIGLEKLIEIL